MKCVVIALFLSTVYGNIEYNYYWRDYDGSIPLDAISAAYGLYVGQHVHKCHLIPGSIYAENRTFVGEFWGKFESTTDIKILCAPNHYLKWVNVENSNDGLPEEEGCKLVPGGHEYTGSTFRWHIGRVFHEGMWKISKVVFDNFKAMSIWKKDGGYEHLKKFEVLKVCKPEKDRPIFIKK